MIRGATSESVRIQCGDTCNYHMSYPSIETVWAEPSVVCVCVCVCICVCLFHTENNFSKIIIIIILQVQPVNLINSTV